MFTCSHSQISTLSEWKQKVKTGTLPTAAQTVQHLHTKVFVQHFSLYCRLFTCIKITVKWFPSLNKYVWLYITMLVLLMLVQLLAVAWESINVNRIGFVNLLCLPPVVWWQDCFLVLVSFHQTRQVPRIYISVWSWDRKIIRFKKSQSSFFTVLIMMVYLMQ